MTRGRISEGDKTITVQDGYATDLTVGETVVPFGGVLLTACCDHAASRIVNPDGSVIARPVDEARILQTFDLAAGSELLRDRGADARPAARDCQGVSPQSLGISRRQCATVVRPRGVRQRVRWLLAARVSPGGTRPNQCRTLKQVPRRCGRVGVCCV